MCKQSDNESYIKWIIHLRNLAARSGHILESDNVWMKLNDVYKKKTIQMRTKPFTEFDNFCITEENAYEAMKTMRTAAPKALGSSGNNNAGAGRSRRGRGNASDPAPASGNNNRTGGRSEVVRYIPIKFKNLPKKTDPGETDRIYKNNLCFGYRQPGYSAGDKQCPFNTERGRYAFTDVPREMTKA
jgi:hypothetical protein